MPSSTLHEIVGVIRPVDPFVRSHGAFPSGPGSLFVLPTNVGHEVINPGTETLRCVGFFCSAMFTQIFDNVMHPINSHVPGTPNRDGTGAPPPRMLG